MYTFDKIIGHEEIIEHIKHAIIYRKLAHAYIIEGSEGSGKKLITNTFVKTLQCEKKGVEPCNICASCLAFESGNHPDIKYIRLENKKSIGVEEIREKIVKDIEIKPYKYSYKIYIIENAESITEQGQNALLKTIEEPPEYGKIFLLSSNYKSLLRTIQSRCVRLSLKPIHIDKVKDYLIQNHEVPDYQALIYSNYGQGAIGKSLELMNSEDFIETRNELIEILGSLYKLSKFEALEKADFFEANKSNIDQILSIIETWYRDILFIKYDCDRKLLINGDKVKLLEAQEKNTSLQKISSIFELLKMTRMMIKRNTNFILTFELLLYKIR